MRYGGTNSERCCPERTSPRTASSTSTLNGTSEASPRTDTMIALGSVCRAPSVAAWRDRASPDWKLKSS